MGAWGYKVFEDDTSLDALMELMESGSVVKDIKGYLETVIDSDYVEYDAAQYALASAAIIDSVLNGVMHDEDNEEYTDFISKQKKNKFEPLKNDAVKAITRILAAKSELRELWEENDEEFDNWRKEKLDIQQRLK